MTMKVGEETGGIIGLPPLTYVSDSALLNSMPIAEITPCKPNFSSGMTLFRVVPDVGKYDEILENHEYTIEHPIKLAFLADNFPTDTFSNDYGETFLNKMTDVASSGIQDVVQMTGSKTVTEGLNKLKTGLQGGEGGGAVGWGAGKLGSLLGAIGSGTEWLMDAASGSGSIGNLIGGGANIINKMAGGHRVDFPQIWRNSGFTPSYSMTVRLYNPYPGSIKSTQKYIIGPLAVILCLGIPRTTDGQTYNWPFFHQVRSKGIFDLSPAVISNITVIKGGDQQQIAYTQQMGLVDVRIDFTSLYNSMVLEEEGPKIFNRPTVYQYLHKGLNNSKTLYTQKIAGETEEEGEKGSEVAPEAKGSAPTRDDSYETDRVSSTDVDKEDRLTAGGAPYDE